MIRVNPLSSDVFHKSATCDTSQLTSNAVQQTSEEKLLKHYNQKPEQINPTQSRGQSCNILFHLDENNVDGTNTNNINGSNTGNNQSNNGTINSLTLGNNVLDGVSNAETGSSSTGSLRGCIINNRKNINNCSFTYVTQKHHENLLILDVSLVDGDIIVFQEKTNIFDALHLPNANDHLRYLALAERDKNGARDGNGANGAANGNKSGNNGAGNNNANGNNNNANNNGNGGNGNAGNGNDATTTLTDLQRQRALFRRRLHPTHQQTQSMNDNSNRMLVFDHQFFN